MTSVTPEQLNAAQQWRYAVKVFDPTRKIPAETWAALENTLVLAPSSFGLQPYRFLVIADRKLREALMPHAWNQRQVVDCSHFVVFLAKDQVTEADVDHYMQRISGVRGVTPESLHGFRSMLMGDVVQGSRFTVAPEWTARQAYIALGDLMTCAALLGVDACPMEGLVPSKFDEALKLSGTGYHTAVACALGYRSPDDKYASLPKVRFPANELIQHI